MGERFGEAKAREDGLRQRVEKLRERLAHAGVAVEQSTQPSTNTPAAATDNKPPSGDTQLVDSRPLTYVNRCGCTSEHSRSDPFHTRDDEYPKHTVTKEYE